MFRLAPDISHKHAIYTLYVWGLCLCICKNTRGHLKWRCVQLFCSKRIVMYVTASEITQLFRSRPCVPSKNHHCPHTRQRVLARDDVLQVKNYPDGSFVQRTNPATEPHIRLKAIVCVKTLYSSNETLCMIVRVPTTVVVPMPVRIS